MQETYKIGVNKILDFWTNSKTYYLKINFTKFDVNIVIGKIIKFLKKSHSHKKKLFQMLKSTTTKKLHYRTGFSTYMSEYRQLMLVWRSLTSIPGWWNNIF
jgi:hypothetical protein